MHKLVVILALATTVTFPTFAQQLPPVHLSATSVPAGQVVTSTVLKNSDTPSASWVLGVASITTSILGVLITLWWRARIDFELKAAEIVLSSKYPRMAKKRAEILEQLFPNRLPKNFSSQFDATDFPGLLRYEMTLELFKAISSKLNNKEEIQAAWLELFPEVSWKKTAPNNSSGASPCSSG